LCARGREAILNPKTRDANEGVDMNGHGFSRRVLVALAFVLGAALATSALASATTKKPARSATLVIEHQQRGCHSWSLNGGPLGVRRTIHLARGGYLTLTNNDVMAQELVKKSGPAVHEQLIGPRGMGQVMKGDDMAAMAGPYTLNHMGARLKATFAKAGVYKFGVEDRGDYMELKTIGKDHQLALTVIVG
jgi:hypothetical protein